MTDKKFLEEMKELRGEIKNLHNIIGHLTALMTMELDEGTTEELPMPEPSTEYMMFN